MESPHPDERPLKKRRFFTEDSSPSQIQRTHQSSPTPSPPPEPTNAVEVVDESNSNTNEGELGAFDIGMLQAVVGELPSTTLQRLKDVSGSNVERGMQVLQ